jgi:HAMP domain-containing protein
MQSFDIFLDVLFAAGICFAGGMLTFVGARLLRHTRTIARGATGVAGVVATPERR